ncbi:MAG: PIN domain-containing protein [Chthoniobacteraceae bacterium]
MNSGPTITLLRALFIVFTGFLGSEIGNSIWEAPKLGTCGGIAFGLGVVLADRLLKGFSLRMFSSATFGLLLGLVASRLLLSSGLLYRTPVDVQWLISLTIYATLGYIGMMLAMRSNRDEFALIIPYIRFRDQSPNDMPILVDSNIIIDGRLAELVATGFLSRTLIVPRFILEELQTLADSHDPARREKGRLALARLEELQRDPTLNVTIHEVPVDPFAAVDSKLIQLAKMLSARLLSNDGNLCSIARLQGITALSLNDLGKALRPVVGAGDEIVLTLSKEGREPHQAIGYLPDGTMIIVNNSRSEVGKSVRVSISSVRQTSAGRLFFAELAA